MKTILLAIALLSIFIAPVYAESAHDMCVTEVRDAGIEDQEEIDLYIKECVAQVSAELENNQEPAEASDAEPTEATAARD